MTSHGFGGFKVKSSPISTRQISGFAEQVSKMPHVVKAHVVSCETGRYDIIFEFEHLAKYGKKPRDFMEGLRNIRVDDHQVALDSVDFCVIQMSYECGKQIPEPKEPGKRKI